MEFIDNLFISKIDNLLSALIKVVIMHAMLMHYLRVFGKRTASQMSNFD